MAVVVENIKIFKTEYGAARKKKRGIENVFVQMRLCLLLFSFCHLLLIGTILIL